jgi:hypothetical protein
VKPERLDPIDDGGLVAMSEVKCVSPLPTIGNGPTGYCLDDRAMTQQRAIRNSDRRSERYAQSKSSSEVDRIRAGRRALRSSLGLSALLQSSPIHCPREQTWWCTWSMSARLQLRK